MENQTINNNKSEAKEKIVLFVIGVLVGAVISAGAFLISVNTLGANRGNGQMPAGTPPEMSNGQNGPNGQSDSNQNNTNNQSESNSNQNTQNSQPPEKPSNDTNKNNS